jgi:hypothetical protein
MTEASPRAFEVYIGGFGGPSYGVWWDGEQLVYESFLRDYDERRQLFLSPSTAQWRRFWRTMDRIDVWTWLRHYSPGKRFEPAGLVRDGTHWSLTLAHGELSIESSGDSAGPGSVDLDESERFTSLLDAVSRLVGGRPFG